jgi:hypothetical protein
MARWHWVAAIVAVMFGTHNLFVKRAAGRLPDAWGALILEGVAAAVLLIYLTARALTGAALAGPKDSAAVIWVALAGLLIAIGATLYFWVFRLGAPLAQAVPGVLVGWLVVSVLLGIVFEHEVLAWRHAAGLLCAVLAIWLLR